MCPESTFETGYKTGQLKTYLEYYKNQYGIEIRDTKQPLLVNKIKRTDLPEGEISIRLVPELCFLTGLTEAQRNDFRVMKEVADHTRLKPTIRYELFDGEEASGGPRNRFDFPIYTVIPLKLVRLSFQL